MILFVYKSNNQWFEKEVLHHKDIKSAIITCKLRNINVDEGFFIDIKNKKIVDYNNFYSISIKIINEQIIIEIDGIKIDCKGYIKFEFIAPETYIDYDYIFNSNKKSIELSIIKIINKDNRKRGIGKILMNIGLKYIKYLFNKPDIFLSAMDIDSETIGKTYDLVKFY